MTYVTLAAKLEYARQRLKAAKIFETATEVARWEQAIRELEAERAAEREKEASDVRF